jgi:RNA polymerase sigma factor (sigma-70 family)
MKTVVHSDSDALTDLYDENHSWLYTWLCRKLGNQFDAADVAQETFIKLMYKHTTYQLDQPRALLTTIAKNIMHNLWHKAQIRQAYHDVLLQADCAYAPSPEEELIAIEVLLELNRFISSLKPRERKIFIMSKIEKMRYEDIAEQLNVSLITVKRDMKQAMIRGFMTLPLDL